VEVGVLRGVFGLLTTQQWVASASETRLTLSTAAVRNALGSCGGVCIKRRGLYVGKIR
jgi:hypothetical protein